MNHPHDEQRQRIFTNLVCIIERVDSELRQLFGAEAATNPETAPYFRVTELAREIVTQRYPRTEIPYELMSNFCSALRVAKNHYPSEQFLPRSFTTIIERRLQHAASRRSADDYVVNAEAIMNRDFLMQLTAMVTEIAVGKNDPVLTKILAQESDAILKREGEQIPSPIEAVNSFMKEFTWRQANQHSATLA